MVTDDGEPPESAYFDLKVQLTDVNDKPTGITLEPAGIKENTPPGISVITIVISKY